MSGSTYMYAGTRAKTLERGLLTETQLELLTSAKSADEAQKVLYDTYLAGYLSKTGDKSVSDALDESVVEAKEVLSSIAPDPNLLNILWVKYDFHNLKTIYKGKKAELEDEAILSNCFNTGTVSPERLLKAFSDNKLHQISGYLKDAAHDAETAKRILEIDLFINRHYFKAIQAIAAESNDAFVSKFVTTLIDLFNLKAALRAEAIDGIEVRDVLAHGGSYTLTELEQKENVFKLLARFGGEKLWTEAIEHFNNTGKYNRLEKIADEYISDFIKEESLSVFTSASLFSYFQAQKNNAQIIGAILVAKEAGMEEKELRTILRRLHA